MPEDTVGNRLSHHPSPREHETSPTAWFSWSGGSGGVAVTIWAAYFFGSMPIIPFGIVCVLGGMALVCFGAGIREHYIREGIRIQAAYDTTLRKEIPVTVSPPRTLLIEQKTIATPPVLPSAQPATEDSKGRIFVAVTPEYLTSLFKDHMGIQAEALVAPYMGKWMTLSGPLDNVVAGFDKGHQVSLSNYTFNPIWISMHFAQEWSGRLAVVPKGTVLTIIGKIWTVNSMQMSLNECELV